jgi:hypothetical protein
MEAKIKESSFVKIIEVHIFHMDYLYETIFSVLEFVLLKILLELTQSQ